MIKISELSALLDDVLANNPAIGTKTLCVEDNHAVNKLKDKAGVVLLAMYPSAQRSGQVNEGRDDNATWLFILEKDVNGQTDSNEEAQFEKLQGIIIAVRNWLEEIAATKCYLQRLDISKIQILPEWRQFGGWNGWSMSLVF